MSNAETPAENVGGTAATSAAQTLADLPEKTRVHVVAKRLGTTSREVLTALADLGETARSPQSGVSRDVAFRVAEALGVGVDTAGEGEVARPDEAAEPDGA
ncbi:translation initiation factor IF-2 N-terminal domain-containing protein, partial [Saccharomonospora iraqiensis]|uniref:translation initiation factor IF-2 N-terminal domain-containing protein n=1 Tax=Saccharomonospora iraqiensis TaxID=52698 RepID=UPI00047BCE88